MDLVIFYSPEKCCITYYINNDSAGYKIEYPFSYIKNITLDNPDVLTNAEGAASQRQGGLIVELNRPPNFFMDSSGSGGFYQCGDFTEDQQASQILVHQLGGHPKVLSGQLAKLVSLESFQNRMNPFDPHALAVSAPVSPVGGHRPASQPNGMPQMDLFQQPVNPMGLHPHRGFGYGHKRQRSRSVPIAMDFSVLRQPMQPFIIQQPSAYIPNPEIFAPQPQHQHHQMAVPSPLGPNLQIDTSAGYGMDMRQYPMSATTAPSPSDYGTPGFSFAGPTSDGAMPAPSFNMGYGNMHKGYQMLPMPPHMQTSMAGPSASPMSQMGHPSDPVIANQSPPLTSLGRSASADMYSIQHGQQVHEDIDLAELYNKGHMHLPFRPNYTENHVSGNQEQDMNNFVNFIDPSNLQQ